MLATTPEGLMTLRSTMTLRGTLELSDSETRRTVGGFAQFVTANDSKLREFFGHKLFPGSLNVLIEEPPTLQQDLDAGRPTPLFVIPKHLLDGMPVYIGDGQAWACNLHSDKFPSAIGCWIFRRIRSRVPRGVIEIVAVEPLVGPYKLQHGDQVNIEVFTQSPGSI
jgi:CTP-dependent riboflavin kinase